MGTAVEVKQPVIFFDGVCNLCDASVHFILQRDKKQQFQFASLQSTFANETLPTDLTQHEALQSLVLLSPNGKYKTRSSAALTIAKDLSGGWPLLYVFMIVPPFIRNAVYDLIAKNRYRLFGKKDECMIPTPALQSRFLD